MIILILLKKKCDDNFNTTEEKMSGSVNSASSLVANAVYRHFFSVGGAAAGVSSSGTNTGRGAVGAFTSAAADLAQANVCQITGYMA